MPTVRVTRQFAAPAELVFDAWLNAGTASRFLFKTPTGQMVRCEIDPRVGGAFNLTERRPEPDGSVADTAHVGHYEEISRPNRLVFTFAVPRYSPDYTRVTLNITSTPDGSKLDLTHEVVPEEWASSTQQGWTMILDTLAGVLEHEM